MITVFIEMFPNIVERESGRKMMEEEKSPDQKLDPERLAALRNLPKAVMESLTKEEVNAFLHQDDWPDSLREKLKDYLVDEE
jgi:hypothetical protein